MKGLSKTNRFELALFTARLEHFFSTFLTSCSRCMLVFLALLSNFLTLVNMLVCHNLVHVKIILKKIC